MLLDLEGRQPQRRPRAISLGSLSSANGIRSRVANSACSAGLWALTPRTEAPRAVELGQGVAVGAALRRAAAGARDVVPACRQRLARPAGPGIDVGDEQIGGRGAPDRPRRPGSMAASSPAGISRPARWSAAPSSSGPAGRRSAVKSAHVYRARRSGRLAMARYVAFLRGMNLGDRRIKNADSATAFEGARPDRRRHLPRQRQRDLRRPMAVDGRADRPGRSGAGRGARLRGRRSSCARRSRCAAIAAQRAVRRRRSRRPLQGQAPGRDAGREARRGRPARRRSRWRPTRTCLAIEGARALLAAERRHSRSPTSTRRRLEKELGPWTMRTMGTIEQIAAKYCA